MIFSEMPVWLYYSPTLNPLVDIHLSSGEDSKEEESGLKSLLEEQVRVRC